MRLHVWKKSNKNLEGGFSIVELLVTVAIIVILASLILANLNRSPSKARDTYRAESLRQLEAALESYKMDYGRYPITSTWHGYLTSGCGNAGELSGASGYIPGLAPTYISSLPVDPSGQRGGCNGFLYYSGGDGVNYKLLIHNVGPESFPAAGELFHDPIRPTWAWMICSGGAACSW